MRGAIQRLATPRFEMQQGSIRLANQLLLLESLAAAVFVVLDAVEVQRLRIKLLPVVGCSISHAALLLEVLLVALRLVAVSVLAQPDSKDTEAKQDKANIILSLIGVFL